MDFFSACISRSFGLFGLAIRGNFYPSLPTSETAQRDTFYACDSIINNLPSLHVTDGADRIVKNLVSEIPQILLYHTHCQPGLQQRPSASATRQW